MFDRINRRLAILAREIEASKPKTVSFEDFEKKVFPYPSIKGSAQVKELVADLADTSSAGAGMVGFAPPSAKFKVGDRVRIHLTADVMNSHHGASGVVYERKGWKAPDGSCYVALDGEGESNRMFAFKYLELIPPQQKEEDGLVAGRVYLYQGTYGKHYRKVFADGFGAACNSAKEADAVTRPRFFRERDKFAVENIRAGLIREATPEELAA